MYKLYWEVKPQWPSDFHRKISGWKTALNWDFGNCCQSVETTMSQMLIAMSEINFNNPISCSYYFLSTILALQGWWFMIAHQWHYYPTQDIISLICAWVSIGGKCRRTWLGSWSMLQFLTFPSQCILFHWPRTIQHRNFTSTLQYSP